MISSVKSMVRKVNDIIDEVLDGLNFIQIDVERIKDIYGSIQNEDFKKVLMDVDNLVNKLINKLFDFWCKIESIN